MTYDSSLSPCALVDGDAEGASRRDSFVKSEEGLMQAGRQGGQVKAELDHLVEGVVDLGDQAWCASAPSWEYPGEAGQPEGEGKGETAPVEVPEGGQGLRR